MSFRSTSFTYNYFSFFVFTVCKKKMSIRLRNIEHLYYFFFIYVEYVYYILSNSREIFIKKKIKKMLRNGKFMTRDYEESVLCSLLSQEENFIILYKIL